MYPVRCLAFAVVVLSSFNFSLRADEPAAREVTWLSDLECQERIHPLELQLGPGAGTQLFSQRVESIWLNMGKGVRASDGKALKVAGKPSPHGISVGMGYRLTYSLGNEYGAFETTVALEDDSPSSYCQVVFQVLADDQILWESQGICKPGESQHCLLDVRGAKTLSLHVAYHHIDAADAEPTALAVWFEPQLRKAPPKYEESDLPPPSAAIGRMATSLDHLCRDARRHFENDEFAELEKLAKEARESNDCHGYMCRSEWFYYSFCKVGGNWDDDDYQKRIEQLKRWQQQFPESPVPKIALTETLVHYAWLARGSGFANSVTEEEWALFGERLAEAREQAEAALALKVCDPYVYYLLTTIARGQGWTHDELRELITKRYQQRPASHLILMEVANFLQPKWHGEPGDVERLGEWALKQFGDELGGKIFAVLAMQQVKAGSETFFEDHPGFAYEKLKPGLLGLVRESPASNIFSGCAAWFACVAGDRDTAKKLMTRGVGALTGGNSPWGSWTAQRAWYRRMSAPHNTEERRELTGGGQQIYSLAFSGDGRTLFSGGFNGHVHFWEVESGKGDTFFEIPRGGVRDLFSQGRQMIAAGWQPEGFLNASLLVLTDFEKKEGKQLRLASRIGPVFTAALSPDNNRLALGTEGGVIQVRKIDSEETPIAWTVKQKVKRIRFAPDGATVFTIRNDNHLQQWDADTGTPTAGGVSIYGPKYAVFDLSADGKRLAITSFEGELWIYDVNTKKTLCRKGLPGISDCAYSPDSQWLALAMRNEEVVLLETRRYEPVHRFRGHLGMVVTVTFAPDSRLLASASRDATVKLWDLSKLKPLPAKREEKAWADAWYKWHELPTDEETGHLRGQDTPIDSLCFSSDAKTLYGSSLSGTLYRWDMPHGKAQVCGEWGGVFSAIACTKNYLVLTAFRNRKTVYTLCRRDTMEQSDWKPARRDCVAISPDEKWVAALDDQGVLLTQMGADQPPRQLGTGKDLSRLAFTADGRLLITFCEAAHAVRIWDVARGEMIQEFKNMHVNSLVASANGQWMAASDIGSISSFSRDGKSAKLTDIDCSSLSMSPNGKHLAVAKENGEISLYEVQTLKHVRVLGNSPKTTELAFSPDGKLLVSANRLCEVRLWKMPDAKPAAGSP